MENLQNNPQEQLQDGDISLVDYLNDLAEVWRLQGYSEDEIQQGILAEESRIDNLYYDLDES